MKKIIAIALLFCLVTAPSFATDYYVKNGGNNSAAGTSDGTAWETVGKIESYSNSPGFNAGDNIYFNRGDTFAVTYSADGYRGIEFHSSGSSGSPITIGAYGTGDDPIWDSIEDITDLSWSVHDTNIYKASLGGNYIGRVFFTRSASGWTRKESADGDSAGDIDGSTFLWYHDGTLYVYSPSDPSSYYDKIETARVDYMLYIDGEDYITIENIHMKGGADGGIHIRGNSSNIIIHNPHVELFGGNGIKLYASGSTIDSVDIYGDATDTDEVGGDGTCIVDGDLNFVTLEGYEEADKVTEDGINYSVNVNNSEVKYCTIRDVEHSLLTIQQGSSDNLWEYNILDGDHSDSKYVRGIDINGGSEGGANEADSNIVRYNLITDTNVRSQLGGTNNEYYNNVWADIQLTNISNKQSYASDGVHFSTWAGCGGTCVSADNKFYNNTIYNVYDECIAIDWGATGNEIYNNILMNCGFGTANGADLCVDITSNATASDNLFKNNTCYGDNGTSNIEYKGTVYSISEADSGCSGNCTGEFADNVAGDAKLYYPDNDNLYIQLNSPAINAGYDTSGTLTDDFQGFPRIGDCDIGAYEYQRRVL